MWGPDSHANGSGFPQKTNVKLSKDFKLVSHMRHSFSPVLGTLQRQAAIFFLLLITS